MTSRCATDRSRSDVAELTNANKMTTPSSSHARIHPPGALINALLTIPGHDWTCTFWTRVREQKPSPIVPVTAFLFSALEQAAWRQTRCALREICFSHSHWRLLAPSPPACPWRLRLFGFAPDMPGRWMLPTLVNLRPGMSGANPNNRKRHGQA